jgi:two-component system response regulator AtoC
MNPRRVSTVLVIEDHPLFAQFLSDELAEEYHLDLADNAEAAAQKLKATNYDLFLLDLGLPARSGMRPDLLGFDILKQIKESDSSVEVIIITGTAGEVANAVRAIKDGAFDFIIKDDPVFSEKLHTTMQNALRNRLLEQKNRKLAQQNQALANHNKQLAKRQNQMHKYLHPGLNYHFELLLGDSKPMQEVYDTLKKLSTRAPEATVLICGESGTGKELVALSIHALSPRRDRVWIPVNLIALPKNLIETELFGIEDKIASDVARRTGLFKDADGGSIFLDEISEAPLEIQAKLLRVLQQKEIQRAGLTKPIPVDVRVIAATNQNLENFVREGKFRRDLYYRLNVMPIFLPPLRERRDDIPLIVQHMLYGMKMEERNFYIEFSPEAIELLQEHDWPGNIRELENVVKQAVISRNNDRLTAADFHDKIPRPNKTAVAENGVLGRLPAREEMLVGDEAKNFIEIRDEKFRRCFFLRTLIEREGSMEEVLTALRIARNTGYKMIDEVLDLFLAGLCLTSADLERLAQAWHVEAGKLEKTVRSANRLHKYFQDLQNRFANDANRLAAYLNVAVDQLNVVEKYFDSFKK